MNRWSFCSSTSPAAALSGGGKLPIAIYESIYEATEDENKLGLKSVPLPYTIERR